MGNSTKPDRAKKLKTRPDLDIESWLTQIQALPENEDIDVREMYRRMLDWCKRKGQTPTRRRLLKWIDNEHDAVPIDINSDIDCQVCGNQRTVVTNDFRAPCPECRPIESDAFWKARGK